MRGPTVKSLVEKLSLKIPEAKDIKRMMSKASDIDSAEDALIIANIYMGESGVESLYPEFPNFLYINAGDTYRTTLCFSGNQFYIGNWGDYVERNSKEMRK